MNHVLGAVAAVAPPQNANQLLETLARIWADKPGGRTRQIQIQSTAALLRWAVAERRLGNGSAQSKAIRWPVPNTSRKPGSA